MSELTPDAGGAGGTRNTPLRWPFAGGDGGSRPPHPDRDAPLTPDQREARVCACGHGIIWHHDTRGCGYLGYDEEHCCPCSLPFHDALDALLKAHVAAAEERVRARWVDWLASCGYGIDYRFDTDPPCALEDLADAWLRVTGDEDAETWAATIAFESGPWDGTR